MIKYMRVTPAYQPLSLIYIAYRRSEGKIEMVGQRLGRAAVLLEDGWTLGDVRRLVRNVRAKLAERLETGDRVTSYPDGQWIDTNLETLAPIPTWQELQELRA